ncbi:hypothetical protein ACUODF_08765, partial [Escherichia coli]
QRQFFHQALTLRVIMNRCENAQTDSVAALGMRVLGNPYGNDPRIISGESGAVGLGVLAAVHYHPQRQSLMEKLALNKDAVVLVISTEGDTDVKHYREVVWEGKHAVAP